MKKMVVVSMLALLGAAPSFAERTASLEDAVMMASEGLVIRGTVLDSTTEGKDAPIPKIEPGTQPLLHTTWRVHIDDCYYSGGGDCGTKIGTTINLTAITGAAIEREGTRHYEQLITNSVTLAATAPLNRGGSLLLFVRPNALRPGSYQVIPLSNGSQALNSDRIEVELRRYELLSEATKALPATEDLHRRRTMEPSAPYYHEEVPLKDLAGLIERIRGNASDRPQVDPQSPQH